MTSASLLVVLIVAAMVGGITGMVLGDYLHVFTVSLAAGFFGVIAAAIAQNFVVARLAQSGPDTSRIPGVIVIFSVIASFAGSLAAEEINERVIHLQPGMVGAFAGLLSALLMALLVITYHMRPDRPRNEPFT